MPLASVSAAVVTLPRARRWKVFAWSGAALALLWLVWAFDATWWRPLVQHYIQQRSGRQVSFEDMDVGLAEGGRVQVALRGVQIQNAPWARPEPLVKAGLLQMDFSWRSLWADHFIISRLTLVDAQVDLERQADGLRNWRLTRPDDRGPGRVRVQAVNALRTRAHVVDGALGLELELAVAGLAAERPAPEAVAAGRTGPPLTRHVSLAGQRRGTAFKAEVDVSDVVTLLGTDQRFSLQGVLTTPLGRLSAQGLAADVAGDAFYLGQWAFEGRGVGELAAVLGPGGTQIPMPLDLPVKARAGLAKQGDRWRLSELSASLGRSDLAGDLTFLRVPAAGPGQPGESRLQGTLRSQKLDTAELRGAAPGSGHTASALGSGLQADLEWQVQRLAGLPPAPWENVRTHVAVRGGRVTLSPLAFSVWGGEASGRISADSQAQPLRLSAELRVPALPLSALAGGKLAGQGVAGDLAVQLSLSATGDTAQALASAVQGDVAASLRGTTLPAGLEAKVGLDGGRWLRSLVGADRRVAVTCSALALQFRNGVGEVRQLALETPHLAVTGTGRVDLPAQRYELWLAPRRKQSALLALDRWLHLRGGTGRAGGMQVETVEPLGAAPAGACKTPA